MGTMDNTFSTIILASGLSERMGQSKALLKWNQSTTFIEQIINEFLKAGSDSVICMINEITEPFCKKLIVSQRVRFIVNHHPDWGRFYSIKTGLNEVKDSRFCFIHNVDNPFVGIETIDKLLAKRNTEAWCSPVYINKGGHPVLLPNSIIKKITQVNDLNLNLIDILNLYPKIKVELNNDTILRNINTPEDYNKYFETSIS